jgi:endonuclease IV
MDIGFHLGTSQDSDIVKDVEDIGISCLQIFTRNPMKRSTITVDPKRLDDLNKNVKVFTHIVYYINVTKKTKNGKLNGLSIKIILDDINFLTSIKNGKGIGAVLHLGSSTETWGATVSIIIQYLKLLSKNMKRTGPKIIIENRASAGNIFLTSIDEMILLDKELQKNGLNDYTAFCFDTCHDFISSYKMSHEKKGKLWYPIDNMTRRKVDDNLQELIDSIGHKRISVVHLNDSKSYTKDEHEDFLDGLIPDNELLGVLDICKKYKIPMIVERSRIPKNDKIEMIKMIKSFI